jgi:hypothetical protein
VPKQAIDDRFDLQPHRFEVAAASKNGSRHIAVDQPAALKSVHPKRFLPGVFGGKGL